MVMCLVCVKRGGSIQEGRVSNGNSTREVERRGRGEGKEVNGKTTESRLTRVAPRDQTSSAGRANGSFLWSISPSTRSLSRI